MVKEDTSVMNSKNIRRKQMRIAATILMLSLSVLVLTMSVVTALPLLIMFGG